MQFAHAGHHQLLGLRVAIEAKGRVFFVDLVQGAGQLGFVAAALGQARPDPTIGVGKWIVGIAKSPRLAPVCRSSILATATMSPGPASSTLETFRCLELPAAGPS